MPSLLLLSTAGALGALFGAVIKITFFALVIYFVWKWLAGRKGANDTKQ
jgi:hypothetical protein